MTATRGAGPDVWLIDRHVHLRVLLLRVLLVRVRRLLAGRVDVGLMGLRRLLRRILLACTWASQHIQQRLNNHIE